MLKKKLLNFLIVEQQVDMVLLNNNVNKIILNEQIMIPNSQCKFKEFKFELFHSIKILFLDLFI